MAVPVAAIRMLAGYSGVFPVDVTRTASASSPEPAACSQEDAELTWQPLQDTEPAALGYRVLTVAADGVQTHVDTDFDYAPTLTSENLLASAYFDPEWVDFLMGEFSRTGQVGACDGALGDFFDYAKPSEPQIGVYIMGFQTGQISVPFDLSCAGDEVGSGPPTTSSSPLIRTVVFCGDGINLPAIDADYLAQPRSYCPAS